jgi:hypothetical protein
MLDKTVAPVAGTWMLRAALAAAGSTAIVWLIERLLSTSASAPIGLPQFMPGRPLRVDGAVPLESPGMTPTSSTIEDRIRDAWLADAHAEYASVAAFGRLSLHAWRAPADRGRGAASCSARVGNHPAAPTTRSSPRASSGRAPS